MGQSAMAQFVFIPLIIIGLFSIFGLIAWLSRKRPDSFFYRFAQWWISFLEHYS